MQHELHSYQSGGFFAGDPDTVPQRVRASPGDLFSAEPSAEHAHGLWLHPDDAELLLEEELPLPPARRPAVQQLLQRALTLESVSPGPPEVLGFQLIGFEGERVWTWAETGLVGEMDPELGAEAGAFGLIADRTSAAAAAHFLNREDLGPPVIWRPWLVTRHWPPVGGV